nr:integrase, catalytic region, zinc finger, CCHC-type, peptidase aspartic, catalytic [Tanacetum cinerariifolium]
MKTLKEKVKDKLIKQDQYLETVHMLCRPRPNSNELNRVAIGYKNPLCLTRAKQVQHALYNGHEIIEDNHTPTIVHHSEDTLEIAEINRKKMNDKMNDPECVTRKVKISPHDYSKENLLATFTPQKQLTPEQIFWSNDLMKLKSETLKEQTKASRPIKAFTLYPPNTPATLVPKVLTTKSQVKIYIFTLIQLFSEFNKTCKKRITPTGLTDGERGFEQTKTCYLQEVIPFFKTLKDNFEGIQKALTKEVKEMKDVFEELEAEVAQYVVDRKRDAIELKNLLIANDKLITECLSQEVFCVATNSELNIARFTEMYVANTTAEARCLALEVELANLRDANLRDTNNHDNQKELINHFSKLEVNHLNLQLKYQNLKDNIGNNPPTPDKDTLDFDFVFVIGKMQASLQEKDNVIRQLKKKLSQLQVTRSDTDRTFRVQTTDSQITKLTDQVTHLQVQNDLFRAENDKIKQHYKELYDSIKITRAKHIEQVTKLTTKNVNLKTRVSKATVNPQVFTRDKHAIDVKPIVPRLRNNRDAHLDNLRHLKESVETIRDIVEEAKVVRPRDRSIVSACRYTKHSQELLEYAIGTCPQGSQQRATRLAYIPLIRKKQVTVAIPSDKSDSTTHPHVVTVKSQKTNVSVPPSTGVNSCPNASGSQPKSHVKSNRISPAKCVNKLPVEDQPRKIRKLVAKKTAIPNNGYFIGCILLIAFWGSAFCVTAFCVTTFCSIAFCLNKMADLNAPPSQTPAMEPPLHTDDQILPHIMWVPIGKSNCYLDLEKSQSNPIYKILVDLLKNTNFFKAFTTSSTIPSIYIQQFWDTILYDKKAGCYRCQLDEQWFVLTKETLREALHITPVNNNQAFAVPPSIDGLTSGFERPMDPVLQILWGIVTRTNFDYAERIWEEFTQSIHTFIEDKWNLSRHTSRKKRATLIVIPSIRFTRLIIHHLQRRHRFHPRPDSLLHLANEEPVLGYLKFSAKEIQQALYYWEYLAKVDQHRRYLAGETGVRSAQPAPTSAPAKPQEKKLKHTTETSDKPPKEKKSKHGWVADEDAEYQKVLEESMKDAYALPRGTLPPVVIREPDTRRQALRINTYSKGESPNLLDPPDMMILHMLYLESQTARRNQKVVLGAEEGGQDDGHARPDPDAQAEDQTGSIVGAQAEDQTGSDAGAQAEGQAGSNPDETSEGQARSNPDETSEGQARPDPGDAKAKVQSVTSHVVHAKSDSEYIDLDVADVSPKPSMEQLDERFTVTAYPKVQENLKLAIKEPMLLEEPASSSGTLSSLLKTFKPIRVAEVLIVGYEHVVMNCGSAGI